MAVDDESVYLDQTDEKYGPLFREGRIGMMVTGPWEIYDTVQAGIDYGVVQLPGTDGDHTTVSGPDLWTLYDHQDPDRAYWSYELIKWMTQNDQDARFNLALGNLPLRSSAVDTPAFDKFQADYPGAEVFVANQENATIPRPTVTGYVGLSTAVGRSVAEVLQGAKSVPDALARGGREGRQRPQGRGFVTAGSATEAEIASQPAIWRLAADLGSEPATRAALVAPGERVLAIGCGTSAHVALSYAVLREEAGLGLTDYAFASQLPGACPRVRPRHRLQPLGHHDRDRRCARQPARVLAPGGGDRGDRLPGRGAGRRRRRPRVRRRDLGRADPFPDRHPRRRTGRHG